MCVGPERTLAARSAVRTVDAMRISLVELVLLAVAAVVAGHGAPALRGAIRARAVVRASWTLTPGVLNPAVTQATIAQTICRQRLDAHRPAARLATRTT